MDSKLEREWKSIVCPAWKEKTLVMCEWDTRSNGDRIKRTLKRIDCYNPRLTELGGTDCGWACEKAVTREEMSRSGMEWLLVCAILLAGILWILFYDVYMSPYLHFYGLSLFLGIPCLISLMLYYIWKMSRHILRHKVDQLSP